ncbi:hypothetical protein G5B38_12425 [Pseudohalocynthiibacter aestuariivivens]|nr:hypothetical protein [Pseudohalocynthiibacter aestuariivivens]QIE46264.1 hypothetical protein G5B38_12425 [Pseudohalocynthiibacter aestuariivivens]
MRMRGGDEYQLARLTKADFVEIDVPFVADVPCVFRMRHAAREMESGTPGPQVL